MQNNAHLRMTFMVDLLLLAIAFPVLYFPKFFPLWALAGGFATLALGWCWRRWRLGFWRISTPIDWPLFLLFFVMLPISIWAAPDPLRQQYSWPRAYILVWNFCLFWVVVIYGSLSWQLLKLSLIGFMGAGTAIALVAPLGTNWLYKFALLDPILRRIPSPLIGVFNGADSGFHPNQVAGTLLYVLPLMIALSVMGVRSQEYKKFRWWILASATVLVLLVFFTTQSRSGFLGLAVGLVVMGLLPSKWGRWGLVVMFLGMAGVLIFLPEPIHSVANSISSLETTGDLDAIGFRQEVWTRAIDGINDFPISGMGLGTFRQLMFVLYPSSIPANYNLGHAHNFFLQSALDLGLPGLIAILSLYISVIVTLWMTWLRSQIYRNVVFGSTIPIMGFIGCLVAQSSYSLFDAVALGAKTNFFLWYLFALIFANTIHPHPSEKTTKLMSKLRLQ